ncbi:MAG: hypothetical protein ACYC63_16930 [Armatimonadota bacterium]
MPDLAADAGQAFAAPAQPVSTPADGGTLPSPAEYDAADVSDYADSDPEAMNILLAAGQEDTPATPAAPVDGAAPETPEDGEPVHFASEFDSLSDDEVAARAAGMTPAQLRAAFGNGKAMNRGLNEKMRANADRERALFGQQQQLAQQQQQLLESYRGLQPTPAAPAAPAAPETDFSDMIDPISGEIDTGKLRAAIRAEATAIADAKLAPITAAETQRQQRTQQAETERVVGEINSTLGHMRGAFPHFNSPAVEQAVLDRMVSTNNPDPMSVYATMYRKEYADTIYAFEQKKRAAAAKQPPPSAPATPPGVRGQAAPVAPEGLAETSDAMAKEIARLTGVPLRRVEQ